MKLEKFNDVEHLDNSKKSNCFEVPSATKEDKKKLEQNESEKYCQPKSTAEKMSSDKVKDLSDREKIAYYKKHGFDNLADNRRAILHNNEGNSNNNKLTKFNSHNFDKLSEVRKRTPEQAKNTKESFAKWNPDAKEDENLRKHSVLTRHAVEGEKGKIAHNNDGKASGEYIAKAHNKKPEKIIEHAALPQWNKAEKVSNVELDKDQNLLIGQAAPQHKFEKKKTDGGDGIPRNGGLRQIVTEGGYKGDEKTAEPAIRYVESKNQTTRERGT